MMVIQNLNHNTLFYAPHTEISIQNHQNIFNKSTVVMLLFAYILFIIS